MHLAKIKEMKSISNPRLPDEIYTSLQNLSTEDFRNTLRARMGMPERSIFILPLEDRPENRRKPR